MILAGLDSGKFLQGLANLFRIQKTCVWAHVLDDAPTVCGAITHRVGDRTGVIVAVGKTDGVAITGTGSFQDISWKDRAEPTSALIARIRTVASIGDHDDLGSKFM